MSLTGDNLAAAANSIAAIVCDELLQARRPLVALNSLVATLVSTWTSGRVALCVHHAIQAVVRAQLIVTFVLVLVLILVLILVILLVRQLTAAWVRLVVFVLRFTVDVHI